MVASHNPLSFESMATENQNRGFDLPWLTLNENVSDFNNFMIGCIKLIMWSMDLYKVELVLMRIQIHCYGACVDLEFGHV